MWNRLKNSPGPFGTFLSERWQHLIVTLVTRDWNSRADLYRNRFNRLMEKIGNKRDKVFDLLTRDSHMMKNHALNYGSLFISTDID